MYHRSHRFLVFLFCCLAGRSQSHAQTAPLPIAKHHSVSADTAVAKAGSSFQIIPLGVRGGLDESNLSAYMLAPKGSNEYVCLDAGTLYSGISKSVTAGLFGPVNTSYVLKNYIKAYLISHAHLDHVAGLIINAPEDTAKTIFGMPYCLDVLKEKYFTWEGWANFGDAGEKPLLNKYHYSTLVSGQEELIAHTELYVTPFPLSHGAPYESTAFLLRHGDAYLLYLGDTGADTVEHSNKLQLLWDAIGPLLKTGKLKAIMIEVSFPDEQPVKQLFGHLTPALLMNEMQVLRQLTGKAALNGFPILITHMKPSGDQERLIRKELTAANPLHLQLIFPAQAVRLDF